MPKIIKTAKGTYTAATITVDGSGRVIDASAGAGAANMTLRFTANGPASGNFATPSNASKYIAYGFGGGGGGGGGVSGGDFRPGGGTGGAGGKGFFAGNVDASTTYAYSIGSGGSGGGPGSAGGAGNVTNVTNLFTVNGGGGGNAAPGSGGSAGTFPGGTELSNNTFLHGNPGIGAGGDGGTPSSNPNTNGSAGSGGHITVYDNG
jgi:hypothetical protein